MVEAGDNVKLGARQRAIVVAGFEMEAEQNKQVSVSSIENAKLYAEHLLLSFEIRECLQICMILWAPFQQWLECFVL